MKNTLGKQHESKPATASDRAMSVRHHAHRDEIKKLEAKGADPEKILKKSIKYNESHAEEHIKANEKAKKELAKAEKKRGTSDGYMAR